MNPATFVPLAILAVLGVIVGSLAKRKHRNPWCWGVAGALGFLVALIAILCFHDAAELTDDQRSQSKKREWIVFAVIAALYVLGVAMRVHMAR